MEWTVEMTRLLIAYFATMIVFFAIDFVWLTTVARSFYQSQIGPLLLDEFRAGVAVGFYIFYIAGIVFFAVNPALNAGSLGIALLHGALFGSQRRNRGGVGGGGALSAAFLLPSG